MNDLLGRVSAFFVFLQAALTRSTLIASSFSFWEPGISNEQPEESATTNSRLHGKQAMEAFFWGGLVRMELMLIRTLQVGCEARENDASVDLRDARVDSVRAIVVGGMGGRSENDL